MRTLIIGSGTYGSLAGAALIEAGVKVTFLVRPARQRQLISTGLHITSPLGRFRKPVIALAPSELHGTFDTVILATRANVYQMGLFLAREAITPDATIMPMFDGVHHLGHWRECYPANPIVLAWFDLRASMDADGIVRQTAPAGDLVLGLQSVFGAGQLDALHHALDGRRFRARVAADGDAVLAQGGARAIYRAAAAGASRLSGMALRDAVRFHSRKLFDKLLDEGISVAEARRIPHIRIAVSRYRTGFQREGEPIMAPTPIAAGGGAGSEALFLLGNMLRQAQDVKVPVPLLMRAWTTTPPSMASSAVTQSEDAAVCG